MQCSKVAANLVSCCQPHEHYISDWPVCVCVCVLAFLGARQAANYILLRILPSYRDMNCLLQGTKAHDLTCTKDGLHTASPWSESEMMGPWNETAGAWSIGRPQSNTSLGPRNAGSGYRSIVSEKDRQTINHLVLSDPSIQNSGCLSCMRIQGKHVIKGRRRRLLVGMCMFCRLAPGFAFARIHGTMGNLLCSPLLSCTSTRKWGSEF